VVLAGTPVMLVETQIHQLDLVVLVGTPVMLANMTHTKVNMARNTKVNMAQKKENMDSLMVVVVLTTIYIFRNHDGFVVHIGKDIFAPTSIFSSSIPMGLDLDLDLVFNYSLPVSMVEDLGCLVGKWRNNGYRDGELARKMEDITCRSQALPMDGSRSHHLEMWKMIWGASGVRTKQCVCAK
jgi:hypothetical protein